MKHVPVLAKEVLQYLSQRSAGLYVDGTVGCGGHARMLLEASPAARLVGVDCDEFALAEARSTLNPYAPRVELKHANFAELRSTLPELQGAVDGVLLDVGCSSLQLDDAERGFSFSKDGPLDMRMDQTSNTTTAKQIVQKATERELAEIFETWGEEPQAKAVARAITEAREQYEISRTQQLADIVANATKHRNRRIHPATLTFQVHGAYSLLKPDGGRLAIISFHSLEDRIVKRGFRELCSAKQAKLLFKGVMRPSDDEIRNNVRSRSARLRVIQRLSSS